MLKGPPVFVHGAKIQARGPCASLTAEPHPLAGSTFCLSAQLEQTGTDAGLHEVFLASFSSLTTAPFSKQWGTHTHTQLLLAQSLNHAGGGRAVGPLQKKQGPQMI